MRARSLFERLAKNSPPPPRRRPRRRRRQPRGRRRALLAEDNDINALVAQKALRRLGFEVVRAPDGDEATAPRARGARGAAPPFDVVLMDIKMPGVDGLEAARGIRRAEREASARRAAIVASTASATTEDAAAAEAAGFDAFLVKPVDSPSSPRRSSGRSPRRPPPSRSRVRLS